jgi:hypothetical protein
MFSPLRQSRLVLGANLIRLVIRREAKATTTTKSNTFAQDDEYEKRELQSFCEMKRTGAGARRYGRERSLPYRRVSH